MNGPQKRKLSSPHDKDAAKAYAHQQAAKLKAGTDELRSAKPTARRILNLYLENRSPDKRPNGQRRDHRQAALWIGVLGPEYDLTKISRREWDRFIRSRRSGEINGKGEAVLKESDRREVRDRVVQKDLVFLRAVCHWAMKFRDRDGRLLLDADPTVGLDIPREKNPIRPIASHDRVDAIRKVYHQVTMRIERGARRETVESYVPEIFEIVVGTGRRISAVRSLRQEDLCLEPSPSCPWGAIIWPDDTDKMGKQWRCPMSAQVREALEVALRKRRSLGAGWISPAPRNPEEPVPYEQTRTWMRAAERLAGLVPQIGGVWHPYRRLWVTCRKDLPDVDVGQAGGWSSLEALRSAYQQPDDSTMLQVVTHAAELREIG